jgi:hypothetical protein
LLRLTQIKQNKIRLGWAAIDAEDSDKYLTLTEFHFDFVFKIFILIGNKLAITIQAKTLHRSKRGDSGITSPN